MSIDVRELEPKSLWNNFADLNAVPRPSKKEERVIQFAKSFGESLGLETLVDQVGNVIIRKPATAGMENRKTVVLQSHLDMVHQKNSDTTFDFDTEGIHMFVDEDWVKADGTTLGADNGIGVATILALLESNDIAHPAIEALFTIDEETGMTGALELKGGMLEAEIMLNLDTEDDNELTIGCAGGVDVTAIGNYAVEKLPENYLPYTVVIKGLTGGHSGMDINIGRGNANKLINRVLCVASEEIGIRFVEIDGGGLRNAIPRESFAKVLVPFTYEEEFKQLLKELALVLRKEYNITDPDFELEISLITDLPESVMNKDFQKQFMAAIYACPNGVYRMSSDIQGMVQTSNNLSRVYVKDGAYSVQCLTRGSVDTEKMDLAKTIASAFVPIGATIEHGGMYPGWAANPDSEIVGVMSNLYAKMFHEEAHVNACHAGLECGIIGANYPRMEMISFGPNIRGAHSPDERVQISSVQKYWGFLLETLKRIPERAQ